MNPTTSSEPETSQLFRLDGQVAIITGAGGLLGEQHAIALSEMGARLVLVDLALDKTRARMHDLSARIGGETLAIEADVTRREDWKAILDTALQKLRRVDILVNNAAYTNQSQSAAYGAPFGEFPLEDWNRILEVNLTGTLLGCQIVGSHMVQQQSGSIINLASLYGVVSPNHRMYPGTGIYQPVAYSVSKAGVIALTRYLASLWAEQHVRVNCITPGGVYNDHPSLFATRYNNLSPMGRMADKIEMRGALVYLASAASSYCTGHNLVVDGGWTIW